MIRVLTGNGSQKSISNLLIPLNFVCLQFDETKEHEEDMYFFFFKKKNKTEHQSLFRSKKTLTMDQKRLHCTLIKALSLNRQRAQSSHDRMSAKIKRGYFKKKKKKKLKLLNVSEPEKSPSQISALSENIHEEEEEEEEEETNGNAKQTNGHTSHPLQNSNEDNHVNVKKALGNIKEDEEYAEHSASEEAKDDPFKSPVANGEHTSHGSANNKAPHRREKSRFAGEELFSLDKKRYFCIFSNV
ncbi:hypothetical protein RFI_00708 [Reticulomyxa filosa]|uniref:Uncharacterized protein n=1 Tax=Reticulomyxa filosa TaxID=46433 RepID=X6PE20_RETFI|nr:hypothetical protein RFI_00708 [Reticulomyxa filosa]|eukprot:ETO36353.1 hypothetical protein RFI_00708 [Reticulomyxa filosa]